MKKTDIDKKNAWGRVARHIQAVIQGMLILGFTVQIVLGMVWMWGNFLHVQNFGWHNLGREDSGGGIYALCRSFYDFLGQRPAIVYLLQLGLAAFAGYIFLMRHAAGKRQGGTGRRRGFAVWGSLALLTYPFAMQCHLAVLPYSVMASLFLLMLSSLLKLSVREQTKKQLSGDTHGSGKEGPFGKGTKTQKGSKTKSKLQIGKELRTEEQLQIEKELQAEKTSQAGKKAIRKWKHLVCAILCGALALTLSGAAGADEREAIWGRGVWASLASRVAWPNIWNDYDYWTADLKEITEEVIRETSYYPGNMEILLQAIEDAAGPEGAEDYYRQIVNIGWKNRAYTVVRQLGWDLLGYGAVPLIFRLQLEGRAYDSYTGRNYEMMQEHTPVLTRYYVDYGCWWFGCSLVLAALWAGVRAAGRGLDRIAGTGAADGTSVLSSMSGVKSADAAGKPSVPGSVAGTDKDDAAVPSSMPGVKGTDAAEKSSVPGSVNRKGQRRGNRLLQVCICIGAAGIPAVLYTMRGAGLMDYRCTVGIQELWLVLGLACAGGCSEHTVGSRFRHQLSEAAAWHGREKK